MLSERYNRLLCWVLTLTNPTQAPETLQTSLTMELVLFLFGKDLLGC